MERDGAHDGPSGTGVVVRLLGGADVRVGPGGARAIVAPRLQSLIGFLIVFRDRPVSRQRLAFQFWPDSTEKQARTNLRGALHALRHALDDADRHLRVDERGVQWLESGGADVDLIRFERAVTGGLRDGDEAQLAIAAATYGGDLLEGCYDEWIEPERQRLRERAAAVLAELAAAAHRRGAGRAAVDLTERLLRLDPLDEAAYRRVMELHAAAGDEVRALRTYHECVATLDRELGVMPERPTVALYESLLSSRPERTAARSTEGSGRRDRLPLMGRDVELDVLVDAWRAAATGAPRLVLVTGEPGIGKSRLVDELRRWCTSSRVPTVGGRAYEARGALPYGPIADILRSDVLRAAAARLVPTQAQALGRLVPVATGSTPPSEHGGGARTLDRQQLFDAVATVVAAVDRPLVVAVDDVHWCDADTLGLLRFVVEAAAARRAPLLLVATARDAELASRPELRSFLTGLQSQGLADELPLDRLGRPIATALVRHALGPGTPAASVDRVVAAAEGNPLFLDEMVGVGWPPDDGAALPPRVQAVIESRLDQLTPEAGELATIGAVVGRSFRTDLVARLLPAGTDALGALDELWRRGIVRECGLDGYDFTHDKIREVAYGRAGPGRRRMLHGAVAAAMAASTAGGGEPAQLAHHLERAGQADAAIDAYRDAVTMAAHVFAHDDVIGCCRRALTLVADRPPGPARDDTELDFLVPLGVALMAGPGTAQHEVAVYERARVLRARQGRLPEPSTLRISANSAIARRRYVEARGFGEILVQLGEENGDDVLLTEGHYLIGVTSFWLGELHTSRRHLDDALTYHRTEHTPLHLQQFGQDPRAVCRCRLALLEHHLGDSDRADTLRHQALAEAASTGHPYTDIYVRGFLAWQLADAGRPHAATELTSSFPDGRGTNAMASIVQAVITGWALLGEEPGRARPILQRAVGLAHDTGPQMFEPLALLVLADAHAAVGDLGAALGTVEAAERIAAAEMPFHLPEARRRHGELLTRRGDHGAGVAKLHDAVAVAATHGNLAHEARARASLLGVLRPHDPAAAIQRAELAALGDRFPAASDHVDLLRVGVALSR